MSSEHSKRMDLATYAGENQNPEKSPKYYPTAEEAPSDHSFTTLVDINSGNHGGSSLMRMTDSLTIIFGKNKGNLFKKDSSNIIPGVIAAIVVYAVLKLGNTAPLTDKGINISSLEWKSIVLSCVLAFIVFVLVKLKLQ